MIHTYIDPLRAKEELIKLYKEKEGKITIGFNINTVHFNEVGAGENYTEISKLLIKLSSKGAILVCCHPGVGDNYHHEDHPGIPELEKELFLLNLDATFCSSYPNHVDIIVDQRCGLAQVYQELLTLSQLDLENS